MRFFILSISFFFTLGTVCAQITINEIAIQKKQDYTGKKGDVSWVELYNDGKEVAVSLYFTDDKNNFKKWEVQNKHTNSHKIKKKGYLLIGINRRVKGAKAQVSLSLPLKDTFYLVVGRNDILQIVDTVTNLYTTKSEGNQKGSVGVLGGVWRMDLEPTPLKLNDLPSAYESKKRMEVYLSPLGVTGLRISSVKKERPIFSYGLGFYRTRRIVKFVDFQYGLSFYRIGSKASYSSVDYLGAIKRIRKSESKALGKRLALELKLGVPVLPKLMVYSGVDIGLVNRVNKKQKTEVEVIYADGRIKKNVIETDKKAIKERDYILGSLVEMEYQWKRNFSFSVKYSTAKNLNWNISEKIWQWNLMVGVKWAVWNGRKRVKKWSVVKP